MANFNDQNSDEGSDLDWQIESPIETVLFENIADHYIKGDDVTVFFTISTDIPVNPDEDQIGLSYIGNTNIKECLAFAPVQITPATATGSTRHGTATFHASALPNIPDEFFQFCYILNKTKNISSSLAFQLNASPTDVDLLNHGVNDKSKANALFALPEADQTDTVVIHTKDMLQAEKLRAENRQLLEMKRRLESENAEMQRKLHFLEVNTNENVNKAQRDIETLITTHKATVTELNARHEGETKLRRELEKCMMALEEYKGQALQYAERSRTLEEAQTVNQTELTQVRSQWAVASQLTKEQATHIVELQHRLMQANEEIKKLTQRLTQLEQQMRDYRLTSEKRQISMEGEIETQGKQIGKQQDQIQSLSSTKDALTEQVESLQAEKEILTAVVQQDKQTNEDLQKEIGRLIEEHRCENEKMKNQLEKFHTILNEKENEQESNQTLKRSVDQMKSLVLKHQKSELDAKKQLGVYKTFVDDLQKEVQQLQDRLNQGADEYKALYQKYAALERTNSLVRVQSEEKAAPMPNFDSIDTGIDDFPGRFQNLADNNNQQEPLRNDPSNDSLTNTSINDDSGEARACPMCYCVFASYLTVEQKNEHINAHFN